MSSFADINEQDTRTRNYKGFVQFEEPDTPTNIFRIKQRQSLSITYRYMRDTSYDDAGIKVIDWAGKDHTFSLTIKLSADMFDDASTDWSTTPPTEKDTISFWIFENEINLNPLAITFIATAEGYEGPAGDLAEKFVRQRFSLVPHTFGPITWNRGAGTNEITIIGEVITINYISRESTAPT